MSEAETASKIEVRPYQGEDASQTLAVFVDAITVTAATDYSPEQVAAWARPGQRDAAGWDIAMKSRNTYVAFVEGDVAGFSDVSDLGYVDMMFVSPRYARRGVASALLAVLEARARDAGAALLSSDVSITARAFFERFGFIVEAEQHPVTAGVQMTNFHMVKPLTNMN
jgi:putative acetyltransferase